MYKIVNTNESQEKIRKSMVEILGKTKLLSMATVTSDNKPWINTVYFSFNENLELYILTPPTSNHGQNLEKNKNVAVTVFESNQNPGPGKQGLQLFGTCERVDALELPKALKSWWTRIIGKGVKEFINEYTLGKVYTSRMYKITTNHVKIFDEKAFGEETWVECEIER